jgi:hypothetical protein
LSKSLTESGTSPSLVVLMNILGDYSTRMPTANRTILKMTFRNLQFGAYGWWREREMRELL